MCLTNDLGRSRDESLGGSALVGLAGTRYTGFAAIARVDRDAHRALGGKAAVISDHILFCNYCMRGPSNLVRILKQIRGYPAHWWHVFRHFHCFAATILDRLYLLRGEFQRFDLKLHGKEILHRRMDSGKGCILLGSHLGSFEVLRALGVMQRNFPLKVLMDPTHNQNITGFLDALNPVIASTVIAPDRVDTLLTVKESLDAGFFVGTLGDRVSSDGKTTQCQFLGRPAAFPVGPIVLAAMTHCPVVLFFGLYRGGNRYEIYFEHFADEITLDRDRRAEEIQLWMQRYADRLEHYTRIAPYNWFNFYPFWNQAPPR